MALTATQQRNAVSEGAAFGLVMSGCTQIYNDKVLVDLAFTGAWRQWGYSSRFPQVGTDLRSGDGARVLTRASESKHVWVLFWEADGPTLHICARQDNWDPNDVADVEYALSVIDGDVPLEGWIDLAQEFLQRFDPHAPSAGGR